MNLVLWGFFAKIILVFNVDPIQHLSFELPF